MADAMKIAKLALAKPATRAAGALGAQVDTNTAKVISPAVQWATKYKGPSDLDPLEVMPSPATVSIGVAGGGTPITGSATISQGDARLTYGGNWSVSSSDSAFWQPERANNRLSFMLSGPRFAIRIARISAGLRGVTILVDGKAVSKLPFDVWTAGMLTNKTSTATARHYMLVDLGPSTNTTTYKVSRTTIWTVSGVPTAGSGYAVGDTVTVDGATFKVTSINGSGGIATAQVVNQGATTTVPSANPRSQTATSGSGTGAAFDVYWARDYSAAAGRRIDIICDSGALLGEIRIDSTSFATVVGPVPKSSAPLLVISGDSTVEAAIGNDFAGSNWSWQIARMLGLDENFVNFGTAGRGWLQSTAFADYDLIALISLIGTKPALWVPGLGGNDRSNSVTPLLVTQEVSRVLPIVLSECPNVKIVVEGPLHDDDPGVYSAAIEAGVAAVNQPNRVRYNDFFRTGFYSENSPWALKRGTGVDVHPTQPGHDMIAKIRARRIGDAFQQMLLT